MGNTEMIRTIVGIIGNVCSFGLFLSPIPTMAAVVKQRSVGNFKPDPYVATVLNCFVWVFYGLPIVHPDSILVLTINSVGVFVELVYVSIFIIYSNGEKRQKIFVALVIEAVFLAIVVFVTLYFFHNTADRTTIVGLIAVVFNIIMYAAPLTVMKMVITSKSVKYMPLPLAIGNTANGAIWMVYACLKLDPYVLIPNALGTISGLVQLFLYAIFYKTTTWDDDDGGDNYNSNNSGRGRDVQLQEIA